MKSTIPLQYLSCHLYCHCYFELTKNRIGISPIRCLNLPFILFSSPRDLLGGGGNSWSGNYFKRNSLIIFRHINTCSPNYWYETYWTMQLIVIREICVCILPQISLSIWEVFKSFTFGVFEVLGKLYSMAHGL